MNKPIFKRDTFKEQTYFDKNVGAWAEGLREYEAVILRPTTTLEHLLQLRHTVFRERIHLLILRYSRGESVDLLVNAFPPIVEALAAYELMPGHTPHNFAEFDAYVIALWLVSLAYLLNVDDAHVNELVRLLGNEGRDVLYERLVALRVSGRAKTGTLMYPKPYQPLFEALVAPDDKRTQLILKFLKGYYKGMKNTYWHDSHLGEDAGFFGYWCFELAAFVRALKIDDDLFADNKFYPKELAHWGGH